MIPPVSGNERLLENLNTVILQDRIPHSFMIEGGTLEERENLANYIAKCVVCEGNRKPCDNCKQCHTADSFSNPDISYIDLEDGKKFVSVSQIRNLRNEAFVVPHSAQRRVFIIKYAELMNEQAQNALLKILEEPPKTVVFILLTPSRTLQLETIISRCSLLKLRDNVAANSKDGELSNIAAEFLDLLFDSKEYEMLKLLKPLEKDRNKTESFFREIQNECIIRLRQRDVSKYKSVALTKIYDQTDEFIALLKVNINLSLLFSGAVCKFKSFLV